MSNWEGKNMKACVDQDICMGCELCANLCPAVFQMNTDNKSEVISNPVPADAETCCREAAASCPVDAISVND